MKHALLLLGKHCLIRQTEVVCKVCDAKYFQIFVSRVEKELKKIAILYAHAQPSGLQVMTHAPPTWFFICVLIGASQSEFASCSHRQLSSQIHLQSKYTLWFHNFFTLRQKLMTKLWLPLINFSAYCKHHREMHSSSHLLLLAYPLLQRRGELRTFCCWIFRYEVD